MTPEDRAARKEPEKSWAQEQLEDPEMFSAFCAELEREAGTRAARKALLSLARWARKKRDAEPPRYKHSSESRLSFSEGVSGAYESTAREAERRARRIGK
jgi:hypothetical protein